MDIDCELIGQLLDGARVNPRLRQNMDLRTSAEDGSQRMLNALLPGTVVPVHRHPLSTETVFCLCGRLDEVVYDVEGHEVERIHLEPAAGRYGCVVPRGAWHTVEVLEPSVIFEAKDGRYGEDGSETLEAYQAQEAAKAEVAAKAEAAQEAEVVQEASTAPASCLGDLKRQITYLIGMERQSGSMEAITPLYVSRMLNVPIAEVEVCMKEMGL